MTYDMSDLDVLFQCQSTHEMHLTASHTHYAQVNIIESAPWLK